VTRSGLEAFGALLQRQRRRAGLSQEELAEQAGLSRRGISDMERGERRAPYPATVRQLAAALKLDATQHAALLASAHPEPTAAPTPPPLPIPLTSFIGRRNEVAAIAEHLATTRLLTPHGRRRMRKDTPGTRSRARSSAELSQRRVAS
jgi:transcriptional regulator with XRE-family HTH domain